MNQGFGAKAPNWREQLTKNAAHTRWVITLFIVIYLAVGLLVDMVIHYSLFLQAYQAYYPGQALPVSASTLLGHLLLSLLTFAIIPWATLIMLAVALLSLWVTYRLYDRIMLLGTDYVEVTGESKGAQEAQLYHVVEEMKVAAGLQYMPKIFIINADYMNAFASGYSEKSAMVAITRGLIEKLNRSELQAVMAHELSHIRHGDIKLTLTASVLSNLMLIVLDMLFYSLLFGAGSRRDENSGRGANGLFIIVFFARFVLPIINVLLMLYLSRTREFMADAGCVELQRDNVPLINALLKIHQDHQDNSEHYANVYRRTAHENVRRESYIYDPITMGIEAPRGPADFFSTHPSMEKRLAALGYQAPKTE